MHLPQQWFDVSTAPLQQIVFVKHARDQPAVVSRSLIVESDFTWKVYVHSQLLSATDCQSLSKFPVHLQIESLQEVLNTINQLHLCAGHPDQKFVDMVDAKLFTLSGQISAYVDRKSFIALDRNIYHATVRPASCQLLSSSAKCFQCVNYRNTLRSIHHRWQK